MLAPSRAGAVSADSRSPESHTQAKGVLTPLPRGDLALGQPRIREEGEGSGGAINPPNHSRGGGGGSDIQLSHN